MKKFFLIVLAFSLHAIAAAQLPVFQWVKSFLPHNQYNPTVYTNGRSVAVDQSGNVYTAGLFEYTTDFDPGPGLYTLTADNWASTAIYISKLSPGGDFLWAIQIPTYAEFGNIEIKLDDHDNVYIVSELRLPTDFDPGPGVFTLSPTGGWDTFVAKYDPNGNLVWAKQFGGPGDTVPRPDMIEVDKNNNVIISGNFNNTVDFDPGPAVYNLTSSAHIQAYIVKLNSDGNFIWAEQFGNSPTVYSGSAITDIRCDESGNIYAAGDFTGACDFDPGPGTFPMTSQGLRDAFVAKLTSNGQLIWVKGFGNTTNDYYQFTDTRGLDVDANHNVYVVGDFLGTFDFDPGPNTHIISSGNYYDWYLLKLNAQGDLVWVDAIGGSEADQGADVVVCNDGNVYTCGVIGHIADMDPGPGVHTITTVDQYGASALLKVDANGGFIAAAAFDATGIGGGCLTRRMAIDPQQSLYFTGYFGGEVDFDPGPDIHSAEYSSEESPFVLKLSRCSGITTSTLNISACSSYTLNNETFDSTGTYVRTIPNSTGCDSVITLHLTINKKTTELFKTICEGELYFAGGASQSTPGIYKDTLRSSLNCDSIVVTHLSVNPRPFPVLGPDRDLCAGTNAVIGPGAFSTYLWQDLSTANTITVNAPGLYWVKVTNSFNCSASDSVMIKSILPLPGGFLSNSDSICSYETLTVSPTGSYRQYLWSTGVTDQKIRVTAPGTYWLTVTDANGCTGTDSIGIFPKTCQLGIYFPSAFTPNNDGLNDKFKALVFGKVRSFKLQIYNRDGQIVFQTTDPLIGWDGTYKGISYSSTMFVWQCTYQLEGRKAEYQKGTLTIIR